jgi:hypothetical protein
VPLLRQGAGPESILQGCARVSRRTCQHESYVGQCVQGRKETAASVHVPQVVHVSQLGTRVPLATAAGTIAASIYICQAMHSVQGLDTSSDCFFRPLNFAGSMRRYTLRWKQRQQQHQQHQQVARRPSCRRSAALPTTGTVAVEHYSGWRQLCMHTQPCMQGYGDTACLLCMPIIYFNMMAVYFYRYPGSPMSKEDTIAMIGNLVVAGTLPAATAAAYTL